MPNSDSAQPLDEVDPRVRESVAIQQIRAGVERLRYDLLKYAPEISERETIKSTEKMREFEKRMHQHVEGFCRETAWARRTLNQLGTPAAAWCERVHALVDGMWAAVQRAFRPTLPPNAPPNDFSRYKTVIGDTSDFAPQDWEETIRNAYEVAADLAVKAAAKLSESLAEAVAPGADSTGIGMSNGLAAPFPQGS